MNKLVVVLVLIVAHLSIKAQVPAGYKPIANEAAFKNKFIGASQSIHSISSDFIQVKDIAMLSDKITSRGKFYFKKENKVRVEYTSPYSYLLVMNGNKVTIQDGQKTNSMSTRSSKLFQQINQLMMDCVRGTILNNSNFSVKLYEGSNGYLAMLIPVAKEMKSMFKQISVLVNKTSYLVNRVVMTETSGNTTTITYSNQRLNTPLADALFIVR